MRPTVAEQTEVDPVIAAMTAQPTTLTCSSLPGIQLTHGARPLNMSSDRRDRNRISPIQMKSGNAVSAQSQLESQTACAIIEPDRVGVKNSSAIQPVTS